MIKVDAPSETRAVPVGVREWQRAVQWSTHQGLDSSDHMRQGFASHFELCTDHASAPVLLCVNLRGHMHVDAAPTRSDMP